MKKKELYKIKKDIESILDRYIHITLQERYSIILTLKIDMEWTNKEFDIEPLKNITL